MSILRRLFSHKNDVETSESPRDGIVDANTYYERGSSKVKSGQTKAAIADFTKALEMDPTHPMAYGSRGYAYAIIGRYKQAIQDFTKEIELSPNAVLFFHRAEARRLMRGGDLQETVDDYTKAIQLKPDYAEAYLGRAKALGFLGLVAQDKRHFAAALSDYETFLRLAPDHQEAPSCLEAMRVLRKKIGG